MLPEPNKSKRYWLRALCVFGGALLLVLGRYALLLLTLISNGTYTNDHLVESVSPDRQLKAVTFYRHCPDTPGTTEVSIILRDATLPNEPGNIYRSDSDPALTIRWLDPKNLEIYGDHHQSVELRASDAFHVHITYD